MAAAGPIAQRLGFGSTDVESPVPLEQVRLPAPRIRVPDALAEVCSVEDIFIGCHS